MGQQRMASGAEHRRLRETMGIDDEIAWSGLDLLAKSAPGLASLPPGAGAEGLARPGNDFLDRCGAAK